mgnify:CR=1 FL=1
MSIDINIELPTGQTSFDLWFALMEVFEPQAARLRAIPGGRMWVARLTSDIAHDRAWSRLQALRTQTRSRLAMMRLEGEVAVFVAGMYLTDSDHDFVGY